MYFEIEDGHPDITPVGSVMSWREGVLLSFVAHLALLALLAFAPNLLAIFPQREPENDIIEMKRPEERTTFVFVQPRLDLRAERPPERAAPSDQDRVARSPEAAPQLQNPLPRSRGNTTERVERSEEQLARGQGPTPDPAAGQRTPSLSEQQAVQVPDSQLRLPEAQTALNLPTPRQPQARPGSAGQAPLAGGALGESLRNLQRYVQRDQFDNAQGGGAFGPAIQFDTKGVEFGPWIRRFIAQVKRNWLIPYAAMTMKGRVVVTFNVHKDGTISDLAVVGPSPVDAFNNAAFGALASSNPTAPLPPEYPSDKAFFTVTFFYNEEPQ